MSLEATVYETGDPNDISTWVLSPSPNFGLTRRVEISWYPTRANGSSLNTALPMTGCSTPISGVDRYRGRTTRSVARRHRSALSLRDPVHTAVCLFHVPAIVFRTTRYRRLFPARLIWCCRISRRNSAPICDVTNSSDGHTCQGGRCHHASSDSWDNGPDLRGGRGPHRASNYRSPVDQEVVIDEDSRNRWRWIHRLASHRAPTGTRPHRPGSRRSGATGPRSGSDLAARVCRRSRMPAGRRARC